MEQQVFGTISYYEPSTKKFAALGHGIVDIDTEKIINISNGELVTARIIEIVKGKEKNPRRNKLKIHPRSKNFGWLSVSKNSPSKNSRWRNLKIHG